MKYNHKSIAGLDGIAFAAPALAVISLAFFWIPVVGVILSAAGLLLGFFGWIVASQNEDSSTYYLLTASIFALAALALNLKLATGVFCRMF
jgi:hypothetical protein